MSTEHAGTKDAWRQRIRAVRAVRSVAAKEHDDRRIQAAVDRRFNRAHYDAARTVEAFSARLREHIDLDTLSTELRGVVDQTMQPTQMSLWLRPAAAGGLPGQPGPPGRSGEGSSVVGS